jgi:DNA-directed RNA polymerase specialized sigma24 family protein/CheY-like chemotaxis protein
MCGTLFHDARFSPVVVRPAAASGFAAAAPKRRHAFVSSVDVETRCEMRVQPTNASPRGLKMTLANDILPYLPSLRRFARCLTGGQESGDAYVTATLEALVADPSIFPTDLAPRTALYQVFLKVWNSVALNGQPDAADEPKDGIVSRRLEAITPVARQAFLLVTVEGFTIGDAATVLGKTRDEVNQDLDEAGREIAEQVATNILIIEDEPLIAMDLEGVVTAIGHSVGAIARTRLEAVEAFKRVQPGLILADVQLADGSSGLDAVQDILGDCEIPVVFITAYPEQVLTGLRPEPTFLIPKPFQHETVKAIISQALFFEIKATSKKAAA